MLNGNKKNVVWTIGKVAAGKTSHIRGIIDVDPERIVGVFPGQECRRVFGSIAMANSSNPTAPEETEKFVRKLICDAVDRIEPGMTLFVDGFPRSPNQVKWLYENFVSNEGLKNIFLIYTCDDAVRLKRMRNREVEEKSSEGDKLLNEKRWENDNGKILRVIEELLMRNAAYSAGSGSLVPLTIIDNTGDLPAIAGQPPFIPTEYIPIDFRTERAMEDLMENDDVSGITFNDRNINTMMECNNVLSDQTLFPLKLTMERLRNDASQCNEMPLMCPSVDWTRRFVNRAIDELKELLEELPETWWTKDLADVRKARVELIDAWHFMMSASQSLGMDSTQFAKTYYEKLKVNFSRQANGYLKREKKPGDDHHIGNTEVLPKLADGYISECCKAPVADFPETSEDGTYIRSTFTCTKCHKKTKLLENPEK